MNAQTLMVRDPVPIDFDAPCARLNQWRGRMIENFARGEQAVTETLAVLNTIGIDVKGAKYPHLVGQRFDRLLSMLAAIDPQSGHHKVAHAAIVGFQAHDGLRAMLCHGVTKIAVDRAGHWVALMTLTNFKSGGTSTTKLTMQESEGGAMLAQVIDERRRVSTALGQIRRQLLDGQAS
jgi:hypothetical protein